MDELSLLNKCLKCNQNLPSRERILSSGCRKQHINNPQERVLSMFIFSLSNAGAVVLGREAEVDGCTKKKSQQEAKRNLCFVLKIMDNHRKMAK